MIDPTALRRRAMPIDRSSDRLVALGAITIAIAFLVAAVMAIFLPEAIRRGAWLPLHLALAGGATTAITGVMPFFAAAFAAAPPSDARLRTAAVGAVAIGASAASIGMVGSGAGLAAAGGIAFVAGIVLTVMGLLRLARLEQSEDRPRHLVLEASHGFGPALPVRRARPFGLRYGHEPGRVSREVTDLRSTRT